MRLPRGQRPYTVCTSKVAARATGTAFATPPQLRTLSARFRIAGCRRCQVAPAAGPFLARAVEAVGACTGARPKPLGWEAPALDRDGGVRTTAQAQRTFFQCSPQLESFEFEPCGRRKILCFAPAAAGLCGCEKPPGATFLGRHSCSSGSLFLSKQIVNHGHNEFRKQ